jgi:NodT family efflux transporter outer membrane factor (OMF) lipoprotein
MHKNVINTFFLLSILLVFSSCKTFSTRLNIPAKAIPERYQANTGLENSGTIQWRLFMGDSLLIQLIDSALVGNYDLKIALERIEIARSGARLSKGMLMPQAGINLNGGMRKFGLYTMDGAGNIVTEMLPGKMIPVDLPDIHAGFYASWEVDIWGKLRNQRRSAGSNLKSRVEAHRVVASNLVVEIARLYYELVALDHELEIIKHTLLKQEEALDVVRLQKETGRVNELAVQQFQSQLMHTRSLEFEKKQQITEHENLLNFLLGRYPQTIQRNSRTLFPENPLSLSAGVPSQLLANRPDIREAEWQLQSSKFDLKAAKAAFFPNLSITAGLGYQAFNPRYLFNTPASIAYNALGSLLAPLVNRSALKAHFYTARSRQITAMQQYQQSILNGFVEVENQLSNIHNLQEIQKQKQAQKDILLQAEETAAELYKSNKANYLEVLLAQQNSLQTQLDLVNINKRQRFSELALYKALGGGWR